MHLFLDGEDSVRLLSRISLWLIDRYISRVLVLKIAVLRIKEVVEPSPEIDYILSFIEDSKMGIIATYGEEK